MPERTDICGNCGKTYGSHSSGSRGHWLPNTCPATEGGLDYDEGPGTVFIGDSGNEQTPS